MAHSLILMDASTTALQPAVTMATIQMHTQSMMIVSIGHPTIFIFIIWTEKRKERNTLKEPTRTRRPFQPLLYQLHHIRSYDFVLFLKIKKRVLTLGERKRNTFRSERCIHRRPTRCSLSFSFFFFFLFESWRIRFRALWGMFQSIFSLFLYFFQFSLFFFFMLRIVRCKGSLYSRTELFKTPKLGESENDGRHNNIDLTGTKMKKKAQRKRNASWPDNWRSPCWSH